MKTLAEYIAELRRTRGWTQQQLSQASGVGIHFIRDVEQSVVPKSVEHLVRMMETLQGVSGVEPEKLFRTTHLGSDLRGVGEDTASRTIAYEDVVRMVQGDPYEMVCFWRRLIVSWLVGGVDVREKQKWRELTHRMRLPHSAYYEVMMDGVVWSQKDEFPITLNGRRRALRRVDFWQEMVAAGMQESQVEAVFKYVRCGDHRWRGVLQKMGVDASGYAIRMKVISVPTF